MNGANAGRWAAVEEFADRASDRLNAILIRETRRALNGKLFAIVFSVLLAICVGACLIIGWSEAGEEGLGWMVFRVLFLCFSGVAFMGLPSIISSMVQGEIREKTFELLCITNVTPARIIWGELWTAAGLFLLMASGIAPFMAFSYLLGGVDVRTIATGMGFIFLMSILLSLFATVAAVVPGREIASKLAVVLFALGAWGAASSLVMPSYWVPLVDMWDEPQTPWILLALLGTYLSLGGIFFTVGMARIGFAAANRSGPIRLAVLVHLAVISTIAWFGELPQAWATLIIYQHSVLFLLGMACVGEEEELTCRQSRKGRLARRLGPIWSLFLPGASRGMAFVTLAGIITAGVTTLGLLNAHAIDTEWLAWPWITLAYLVVYFGASSALCRLLPARWRTPLLRRAGVLLVFFVFLMIPLFVAVTTGASLARNPLLTVSHPILFLANLWDYSVQDWVSATLLLVTLAGVVFVLRLPSFIRGIRVGWKGPTS
ncbi:MAG: hypothetical protein HYY16_00760 [Planctomycetes bacterium]|nr:hypothetical protein [Planctomycetota bacterium]